MTLREAAIDEERWSPIALLVWIAARSRRFVEALKDLPLALAEDGLWRLRRDNCAPYAISLGDALNAFRGEAQRGGAPGLEQAFRREDDGSTCAFDIHEFARMDIAVPVADAVRIWPRWRASLAWDSAKARPWRPPQGFSRAWIRSLPNAEYLPFPDVVDVLAFGPARAAIGLSELEEHAAHLRAGVAILNAAAKGEIKLLGATCERLSDHPHLVRRTGGLLVIDGDALRDLIPVPYGGRDWLGPRRYADEYAESGHAPQSVSLCEVMVERASAVNWATAASRKAPGLTDADVRALVLREKETNPFVGIDEIVKAVRAQDALLTRENVREIARDAGVKGRRGRPKKNSAE
jgi:hypothetical protein